jgi:hypothetical protein
VPSLNLAGLSGDDSFILLAKTIKDRNSICQCLTVWLPTVVHQFVRQEIDHPEAGQKGRDNWSDFLLKKNMMSLAQGHRYLTIQIDNNKNFPLEYHTR